MIITISGDPGSGKSTVAKELAKRLHYRHYSGGDMRGMLARDRGLTIDELNKLGEKDPSTDKSIDAKIVEMGMTQDDFVIDSRLAWHFIPKSVKIYLACDMGVAAGRIYAETQKSRKNRKDEPVYKTPGDVVDHLRMRVASDKKRYMQYYGIDHMDKRHYDYVLDTTKLTLKQVIENVMVYVKAGGK